MHSLYLMRKWLNSVRSHNKKEIDLTIRKSSRNLNMNKLRPANELSINWSLTIAKIQNLSSYPIIVQHEIQKYYFFTSKFVRIFKIFYINEN